MPTKLVANCNAVICSDDIFLIEKFGLLLGSF